MIEYSKLQIGCMLIVIYIAFIYFRERYAYKVQKKEIVFELLLFTGIFSIAVCSKYGCCDFVYAKDYILSWRDYKLFDGNSGVYLLHYGSCLYAW